MALAVVLSPVAVACAVAVPPATHSASPAAAAGHWVATWGASAQRGGPAAELSHRTIRNIIYSTVSGSQVEVRVSNSFSDRPLVVGEVAVGVQRRGAGLEPGTSHVLRFDGKRSITIPPRGEAVSDPAAMAVPALSDLAVSVYLRRASGSATYHELAQQTNYVSGTGNFAAQVGGGAFATTSPSWFYIDAVNVLTPGTRTGAVVALGDSITDGATSQINGNDRWPDYLARRLAASRTGRGRSVVDEGISGNRILNGSACFGTSALSRLDRDVLTQAGVRDVILLEGINDIGFSQTPDRGCTAPNRNVSAAQIIAGYKQIIARAHAAGIKIFGGTLTPFQGAAYWSAAAEGKREAVNRWIRTGGAFDGVIDFAGALAAPGDPRMINPAYDSGDHLHPNDAGYRAMAKAVNLAMLRR